MNIYLNGSFLSHEEASVSILDRGFLFGDGVYEVVRSVNGRLFRLEDHLRRMDHGIRSLGIPLPDKERQNLPAVMDKLLTDNELTQGEAVIYLQVTRGAAFPRTHFWPPEGTPPTVMLTASAYEPDLERLKKGTRAITIPDVRWSRCDLKTINLLPNTMAAQQARDNSAYGVLMIRDGCVTEGYNNNVFSVMNGELITYPDSPYILSGITRDVVFEIAAEAGINVVLRPLREREILRSDEVILTGTMTDIQPVIQINDNVVGDGKPGPIGRLLQKELRKRMESE